MDRRTLVTIGITMAIFGAWQKFVVEPKIQQAKQEATLAAQNAAQTTAQEVAKTAAQSGSKLSTDNTAKVQPVRPAETKSVALGVGNALVSDTGQIFRNWDLKNYKGGVSAKATEVVLKDVVNQEGMGDLAFDLPEYAYLTQVQGTLKETTGGLVWFYEDANVRIERKTTATLHQAWLDLNYKIEFKGKKPGFAFLSLMSASPDQDPEAQDRKLMYYTNNSAESLLLTDATKIVNVGTDVKWVGATSRYFVTALVAGNGGVQPKGLIQPTGTGVARASLVYPIAGNSLELPVKAYFGPKELETLRSVEITLDHTIDFGWFTIFAYPLLKGLKVLYQIFSNYGVAIILLTLIVKILTYPLTYKSMKSMKEMARIQPQLQKIRDKYADDKEALNREMMSLMKTHGYNPMAGCLPILIQMPIFIALYRVLYSSIELYHAPFFAWIIDLSAKDPYYITPVLMTATMFIQQKLTPNTATDPVQAKMIQFMPLMMGAFMLTLPSGLCVYMLINALASIVQQLILNKKLGPMTPVAAAVKVK